MMKESQKMRLFLNEPKFMKCTLCIGNVEHLRKSDMSEFFSHKNLNSIYPSGAQMERFKNMEEARHKIIRDKNIDTKVQELVELLEKTVKEIETKHAR